MARVIGALNRRRQPNEWNYATSLDFWPLNKRQKAKKVITLASHVFPYLIHPLSLFPLGFGVLVLVLKSSIFN